MSDNQRFKWIHEVQRQSRRPDEGAHEPPRWQHTDLPGLMESIDQFNGSQSNASMLDEIRAYNHFIVGEFNKTTALVGGTILDIGASPHRYAMEKCFELGVSRYVGIGLGIEVDESLLVESAEGHLLYMNADSLKFADNSFDHVVSMSTFEHIGDVPRALSEIERVLKPGGKALITFEPLWSCAYGHHLHHLGEVARLVPPWSHLVWSQERMGAHLAEGLLTKASPYSAEELVALIFDDVFINRMDIARMRDAFYAADLDVEWMVPMLHDRIDHPLLGQAEAVTNLSRDDLHTKGLSVFVKKRATRIQ